MKELTVGPNDAGQRLDRFLKKYLRNAPLSAVYRIIRRDVRLNGKHPKESDVLREGDVLSFYIPDFELEALSERKQGRSSAKRQFTICYEDDNIIAVSKPQGLLVHGDSAEKKNTLANQVLDYLIEQGSYIPRIEKSFTPSPVHRIDRNTTGLVLFGKNSMALRELSAMIADKEQCIEKYYLTIVFGVLRGETALENRLVKDEERNRVKILGADASEGKYIKTVVRPIRTCKDFTLAEAQLVTGRSHQIRAQLACAGHPLLGDVKYCSREQARISSGLLGASMQLLHASRIVFRDPGKELSYLKGKVISAPLPSGFADAERKIFNGEC